MTDSIDCPVHGSSSITFVCVHIARSLKSKEPCGFQCSSFDPAEEPYAYCLACDAKFDGASDEECRQFIDEADLKLLCFRCFVRAAQLNGIEVLQ